MLSFSDKILNTKLTLRRVMILPSPTLKENATITRKLKKVLSIFFSLHKLDFVAFAA